MRNKFFYRGGAALCALSLMGAGVASPALAQDTSQAPGDEGQTIIVTGSRIASPAATSASPLQVIDSAAITQSGVTNVQDLLLQNPAIGSATFSRTNTSFATASAGVATVDLRNLGVDRTLVLVNGRRFVAGIPGSSAVDLNVIPTQFLERTEILTGGASAVYGSDAVAGVVNFIYKSKFDGLEADAKLGISQYGDGADKEANLLVGKNFADGRANIMLFGGYSKQGTVLKRDRFTEVGSSAIDSTSGRRPDGTRASNLRRPGTFFSGFTPRGRYYTDNYVFTFDRNTGALRPCASTNGGTCDLTGTPLAGTPQDGQPIGPDGFNRSDFRYLAVPVERYVAAGRFNFEVSPALNFFAEGNYARTKASTVIEPFPLASDDIKAFAAEKPSGQINIESNVGGVIYRNPFVPNEIYNDASDNDGDGLRDIFFDKRLADFGGRTSDVTRDLWRIAGGINGKIADRITYEVYGIYGQSAERQTGSGQFNGPRFRLALDSIRDVNDINGNGNVTEIICANAAARAAGCIPANIFGPGSLAPAISYLAAPQRLDTKISQTVVGFNASSGLFSVFGNADPISIGVGGEYRRETGTSTFDILSQGGLNGGNALPPTAGSFNVYEGYAEIIAPILQDRPFVHSFSLRGAVRASKYSTVGETLSYNFGGEWSPVEDIRFRVIKARSVRAPNIGELFAPQLQDFPSGLQDPCNGVTPTSTGTIATNCRAAVGVNTNIAANGGAFFVSQADLQGITSFAGGNRALQEEKGDSFTAGVVINPRSIAALRGLVLTVDYFNIKIKDAIVATPLQFILDQCYGQSNAALCQFIKRRPAAQGANTAGSLDEVNSGSTNSGGLQTSGLDATVSYRLKALGGDVALRGSYTRLVSGYTIPLVQTPKRDEFGSEIGASRDRFTSSIDFSHENGVGLTLTGTYVGVAYLDDQITGVAPGDAAYRVGPQFYLDGQIRFNVDKRYEFFVGAYNLLNNKPPYLADIGADAGQETLAGTYDALLRRFYAGFRIKL